MPYYVFALVDARPATSPGAGFGGPLTSREVPGGFAIVERRGDVPPVEFGTLATHDAIVGRIAAAVPAILPVRFGTLLELDEIAETLADREGDVADAFDAVRGCVQFTWRRRGARPARGARRAKDATSLSGTDYLRGAARAASPAPPVAFRTVRARLKPLVARERYQAATALRPDSLYHLVERGKAERYRVLAGGLAKAAPFTRVTGPFPPFAFTPELL